MQLIAPARTLHGERAMIRIKDHLDPRADIEVTDGRFRVVVVDANEEAAAFRDRYRAIRFNISTLRACSVGLISLQHRSK